MQRARLVRFAAIVADRFLAEFADFVMLRAERPVAFGAAFVGFARTALAGCSSSGRCYKEGSSEARKHENTK
jgi:hypothetical protein